MNDPRPEGVYVTSTPLDPDGRFVEVKIERVNGDASVSFITMAGSEARSAVEQINKLLAAKKRNRSEDKSE